MKPSFIAPLYAIDRQLGSALLLLLFFSVITLYSLSLSASGGAGSGAGFGSVQFSRHCLHIVLAFFVFVVMLNIPLSWWHRHIIVLVGAVFSLCLLTLLFSPSKGASRWISFGVFSLQVSEILKVVTLLTLASWGKLIVENDSFQTSQLKRLLLSSLPIAAFMLVAMGLMMLQKDLGMIFILVLVSVVALMLAGMWWRYIFLAIGVGALLIALLVWVEPYRMRRMFSFADPFADPYGGGYAQLQSLMAYANGGWTGTGLGGSLQKELIPEVHNDFIIAVIAEEWGLLGFFAVCALYIFVITRAIAIGNTANARGEVFGAFYAYTMATMFFVQVAINIGGSLAVLPSKGITLPLISDGGSSLLFTGGAMLGILLRLDYENKETRREERWE